VNKTFYPLLAPFVLSSSIPLLPLIYVCKKDTWELFHRIQLLKKRKKREKKGESEKEKIKRE
jgi:hypothetical protein